MAQQDNAETARPTSDAQTNDEIIKVANLKTAAEVYQNLHTSAKGLTDAEAGTRKLKYGPNVLAKAKGESNFKKFIKNFTSLMAILLWVAGLIAFVAKLAELGIAIWLVNIINGCFSFWQEYQAGKATDALENMLPSYCRVVRNGHENKLLTTDLVPGDVVKLEEGDAIPADIRLLTTTRVQVDQSPLTGEAKAVNKNARTVDATAKRNHFELRNMVYSGTSMMKGSATGVVVKTGMKTDFGKIAALTQNVKDEESPLERELDTLTKQLSVLAVTVGVVFFFIATLFVHYPIVKSFVFGLGMIVAFIPEGLLPTVTLSLAGSVQRMATHHALVKKLSSVEALGSASVICSDKTGTLTKNEMTVQHLWTVQRSYQVTGEGYQPKGKIISGPRTYRYMIDGEIKPLTKEVKAKIMKANDGFAERGLRVLAVAGRVLPDDLAQDLSKTNSANTETDMTFIGLSVMLDPPRPEVRKAAEECHRAHIKIIMVTGDYSLTAKSIAQNIGLVDPKKPLTVVSGDELKEMDDESLRKALSGEVVFSRMAPEQKYRIVDMLQKMGKIVAVTGDGVNDAPALKKADIGVAMGATGTDVAKEAADMILTDDNFASIVAAIREGRGVYSNIRKFLLYILNSNMPEAVPSVLFLLSGGRIPLALTVMEILFIDLGTDLVPALGLGREHLEPGTMDRPPRSQSEHLINGSLLKKAFGWYGLWSSLISTAGFFIANRIHGYSFGNLPASGPVYRQATTVALAMIIACQIANVLCIRYEVGTVFNKRFFTNSMIFLGIIIETVLLICVSYVPLLQSVFGTAAMQRQDWLIWICIPIPLILIDELRRYVVRKRNHITLTD